MRHYESMPPPTRNDEELLTKSNRGELDERSKEIKELLQRSPDRLIARNALLRARKPDHFHYAPEQFETLVDRVADCFSAAVEHRRTTSEFLADNKVSTRARSGFPQNKAHAQDAPHLFLDRVHADTPFPPLTTFFVRCRIYFAYFGKRPSPKSTSGSLPHGVSPRDTSPLFVSESDSPGPAAEVRSEQANPSQSVHEDYQTQQLSEGSGGTSAEDSEELGHQPAFSDPHRSLEDEDMGYETTVAAEDYLQNDSPELLGGQEADIVSLRPLLDPLDLRSPVATQYESNDELTTHSQSPKQLSTPEENASEYEDPEQEDQNPIKDYSSSVYSVRRRSSIREDRDIETPCRFEEDLIRALQERERLDEDWERERLEQEYGALPSDTGRDESVHSRDRTEREAALEAVEEEVETFEHPDGEQRDSSPSDDGLYKATRLAEVVDFKFFSFERGQFRVVDHIRVEPSDTSVVERSAKKYMLEL
ncbi:uncharacterized protein N7473_004362 [Penicillium subrubescens]|uniref:uncharacterized protein n=1 Tax=Penicillium subrubescens TaxID=1316194 RepID=UPI0025459F80|nr:uncharacterized protein N7473_004362 [Penicillium subrubescens]KAJ5900292.1 hypothetical protein N7473_004362 [Penicillium subrubescens]